MALSLLLDECSNNTILVGLLTQAGHRVVRPGDPGVDMIRKRDREVLAYAAASGLTLLTTNPADFKALHDAGAPHRGILAVCQDNRAGHDMTLAEIVQAVKNLEDAATAGGEPIDGRYHVLNYWRF